MALAPLTGLRVAVTADRRREEQVELLRRRGATVVEAPTLRTVPLVDDERLRAAIAALVAEPPDVTVLTTGVGTRGMFVAAECAGLDEALVRGLRDSTVVARGPKAAGAAVAAGLDVSWRAPGERGDEVVERLTGLAGRGARVAVQRDGDDRASVAERLAARGADVVDVPVYRWLPPDDLTPVRRLVDAVCAGTVDAVTFTSTPALRNLVAVAEESGRAAELRAAFSGPVTAVCVGPVCAESAAAAGILRRVVPRRARLGAMVQAAASELGGGGRRFRHATTEVLVRGAVAEVDGTPVSLSDRERGVLRVMLDAGGAVVAKRQLLRTVWGDEGVDEHVVEVTVARLRRRLGAAGGAIATVPRRGYRLVGDVLPEVS
jgi:uroporphyrinogen-III synthase